MWKVAIRLAAFALTILCWRWARFGAFSTVWSVAVMWGGVGLVPLAALAGRRLLDRRPEWDSHGWVTTIVHYSEMILLGCAAITAVRIGRRYAIVAIPLRRDVSRIVLLAVGIFVTATVINLAIQGLGAPFAVALSRKIAAGWLYSRTRNPMVLGCLVFAVVLGFWLQSLHVVLWAALWLSPAWLILVKVYEERELELRFGTPYLEYKRRTPFLWPRLRAASPP